MLYSCLQKSGIGSYSPNSSIGKKETLPDPGSQNLLQGFIYLKEYYLLRVGLLPPPPLPELPLELGRYELLLEEGV